MPEFIIQIDKTKETLMFQLCKEELMYTEISEKFPHRKCMLGEKIKFSPT